MITIILRTVFLYFLLLFVIRLMGKRQIGELQTSEFIITVLLSEIASAPISNADLPLTRAIVPVLVLLRPARVRREALDPIIQHRYPSRIVMISMVSSHTPCPKCGTWLRAGKKEGGGPEAPALTFIPPQSRRTAP